MGTGRRREGTKIGRRRGYALAGLVILVACTGRAGPSPAGNASPDATKSPSIAAQRAADLDQVVQILRDVHPNPFPDGESAFQARVDELKDRAGALSDAGFLVELARLLGARVRDGHTGIFPFLQPDGLLSVWPVRLYPFADGWRVVAAREPHQDLVGAEVVGLGGAPLADAEARLAPFIPVDNAATLLDRLPEYAIVPEFLAGAGLDPGEGIEVRAGDGARTIVPEAVTIGERLRWLQGVYGSEFPVGPPPRGGRDPLYLRHLDLPFWRTDVDADSGGPAVYVGYRDVQIAGADGGTLEDLADGAERALRRSPGARLVIDVRRNPGGDNTTYGPLLSLVFDRDRAMPGSVWIVVGRATFSAAADFVGDALEDGPAQEGNAPRTAGEAMGGAINGYGELNTFELQRSGIVVAVASREQTWGGPDDGANFRPDLAVPIRWKDYVAGRDPVVEAILAAG